MSAITPKADVNGQGAGGPLLTQRRHSPHGLGQKKSPSDERKTPPERGAFFDRLRSSLYRRTFVAMLANQHGGGPVDVQVGGHWRCTKCTAARISEASMSGLA